MKHYFTTSAELKFISECSRRRKSRIMPKSKTLLSFEDLMSVYLGDPFENRKSLCRPTIQLNEDDILDLVFLNNSEKKEIMSDLSDLADDFDMNSYVLGGEPINLVNTLLSDAEVIDLLDKGLLVEEESVKSGLIATEKEANDVLKRKKLDEMSDRSSVPTTEVTLDLHKQKHLLHKIPTPTVFREETDHNYALLSEATSIYQMSGERQGHESRKVASTTPARKELKLLTRNKKGRFVPIRKKKPIQPKPTLHQGLNPVVCLKKFTTTIRYPKPTQSAHRGRTLSVTKKPSGNEKGEVLHRTKDTGSGTPVGAPCALGRPQPKLKERKSRYKKANWHKCLSCSKKFRQEHQWWHHFKTAHDSELTGPANTV